VAGTPDVRALGAYLLTAFVRCPPTTAILTLGLMAGFEARAPEVGYLNFQLYAGDNLIACPLTTYPDNTISTILTGLPDGSTFAPWDPVQGQFLPASAYDSAIGWSTNYDLPLGVGGLVHSPSNLLTSVSGSFDFAWTPPARAGGTFLIADGNPLTAGFQDIVGRPPRDGEWVRTLTGSNQTYTTTTFNQPSGWDNGTPTLIAGQSAFFYLTITLSMTSAPPDSLVLYWPLLSANWVVQRNNDLSPSGWADISATTIQTNGIKQVTVARDRQTNWFYRLRKQ